MLTVDSLRYTRHYLFIPVRVSNFLTQLVYPKFSDRSLNLLSHNLCSMLIIVTYDDGRIYLYKAQSN